MPYALSFRLTPVLSQHELQVFQCIDFIRFFIPPPPADSRKSQCHAGFMPAGRSDTFKGNFKNKFRFNRSDGPNFSMSFFNEKIHFAGYPLIRVL